MLVDACSGQGEPGRTNQRSKSSSTGIRVGDSSGADQLQSSSSGSTLASARSSLAVGALESTSSSDSDDWQSIPSYDGGVLLRENKPFVAGIAGTPFFMAPELFKHQGQRASDYWSLGVTLFWLAAGKMPFEGMTSRQQLMAARRGQVSWRLLPADLSPACVDLLRGLLEPAAKLRYDATILACHPFLAPNML